MAGGGGVRLETVSNKSRPYLCLWTECRRAEVRLEGGVKGEERGRNKGEEREESVAKQQSSMGEGGGGKKSMLDQGS